MDAAPASRIAERRFLLVVIAAGIALRLIWLTKVHGGIDLWLDAAEASNVARAFAQGRGLADAYFAGQGPTAHLLPLNPAIAGTILWLLGPGSTPANVALLGWALAQTLAGWLLLDRLFAELSVSATTRRWGTVLLALLPAFAPQEVVDFQYWEGGTAFCLAVANLILVVRLDRRQALSRRTMLAAAILSALAFFVSPPAGLAVDTCWAVAALRRLRVADTAHFALLAALALALLIAPWAWRNARELGTPVLLRSNAGLELAVANHPDAMSARPPERIFADRLAAVSPMGSTPARAVVATPGGELRYMRMMGEQARGWIAAHPGEFARLYLRHLSEFFWTRPWQMYFSGWEGMRAARAGVIAAVSTLGLVGLAIGLRRRGGWIPALYVAMIALPYGLFQPMPRYIYLTYGILAFAGVGAIVRAAAIASGPRTER